MAKNYFVISQQLDRPPEHTHKQRYKQMRSNGTHWCDGSRFDCELCVCWQRANSPIVNTFFNWNTYHGEPLFLSHPQKLFPSSGGSSSHTSNHLNWTGMNGNGKSGKTHLKMKFLCIHYNVHNMYFVAIVWRVGTIQLLRQVKLVNDEIRPTKLNQKKKIPVDHGATCVFMHLSRLKTRIQFRYPSPSTSPSVSHSTNAPYYMLLFDSTIRPKQ